VVLAAVVLVLALVVQLTRVTVLAEGRYRALALNEPEVRIVLPGLRGAILARNGQPLAISVLTDTVVADPFLIKSPGPESVTLSKLLGEPASSIEPSLVGKRGYAVVATDVNRSLGDRINLLALDGALPGINVLPGQTRYYPDGALAEPVVGRLDGAGQGAFGLEYQYQSLLAGSNGYEVVREAANGLSLPDAVVASHPAHQGANLELTLDPALQAYTERAVAGEMEATRAIRGTAIVMDVATGQILAMVSLMAPSLPSTPSLPGGAQAVDVVRALPTESWINQAVAYGYEPGSVAKIATFAAALEEHLITPSSTEVVPGQLVIDGSVFHDAWSHPTQVMTMRQILAESSNIGTIELAERVGKDALVRSFERFGWGEPTGLRFPGETNGLIKPAATWSPTAIGSTPIGQDQLVTPLQILDSYNAIANGGVMLTPRLVLGTVHHGHLDPMAVPPPRRVVPHWADVELRSLLSGVTGSNATAPAAAIPGYVVAGKTGTSQKPSRTHPGYQPGAYWGTFVGMVPAAHPVLSAIVMFDQPVPIYGGMTAAPVFSEIMRYAIARYGITPSGKVLSSLLPQRSQR